MNRRFKLIKLSIAIVMLLGFMTASIQGMESDFKPVAEEYISSNGISWTPKINYSKLILTISRPDGTVFTKTIESGTTPYANISEVFGESYSDGSYTYELRVIPENVKRSRENKNDLSAIRSQKVRNGKALIQTGYFLIQNGAIVTGGIQEKSSSVGGTMINGSLSTQNRIAGTQDQVIIDDMILSGSLCVGQDCVNGENFGFDTIRLKENNLRIRFFDTSNSGSFPTNDWQITANDSINGGANKFSIDDIDGGRTPFTIEASAPTNSLYVKNSGRVGFGTSTPSTDLHTVSGNTPTLRLEQDSSSGFTAQTWDLAGNEANFFIRDVTNGGTLPVRIRPGAPTSAIDVYSNNVRFFTDQTYITNDGKIGIGNSSPTFNLDVTTPNGTNASLVLTHSGGAGGKFLATTNALQIGSRTNHEVRFMVNNSTTVMTVNPDQTLTMSTGGTYDGDWNNASSRELKQNIKNLSTDEAVKAFDELSPVRFRYKRNKEEEHLGFIAEDVPDLVATNSRKNLSSMDILAVLTKVVQEQRKTINELKEKVDALEKKSKK